MLTTAFSFEQRPGGQPRFALYVEEEDPVVDSTGRTCSKALPTLSDDVWF